MSEQKSIYDIRKFSAVKSLELTDAELELINRQSIKTLTAEDVYVFKVVACDNQVDRDFERFSDAALAQLSKLFVGKTVIRDHWWSASNQTARVYAGEVVDSGGGGKQLVLHAYMLRIAENETTIAAIDGGILREISVGCHVEKAICSVCGADRRKVRCEHYPGREYGEKKCYILLENATDAYEISFVAVPAQPAAGVTKTYGGEENPPEPPVTNADGLKMRIRAAEKNISILEMEENADE